MDHEDTFRLLRQIALLLTGVAARVRRAPRVVIIDADRDTCGESLARIARARR